MTNDNGDFVLDILTFIASAVASFGCGWATAMLMDVPPHKAMASGIVSFAFYVLGNQQSPLKK